jgi:outer membrane protein assembly factor BamB
MTKPLVRKHDVQGRGISIWVAVACLAACLTPRQASAQLDPLLFVKRTAPNVIVAIDLANRMLQDADESYYDPYTYTKSGAVWETTLGVTPATVTSRYRRKYIGFEHLDMGGNDRFRATTLSITGDANSSFLAFFQKTRLSVARLGLVQAVQRNAGVARFGMVKMRQSNARIVSERNEGPVWTLDENLESPTESDASSRWKVTRPVVDSMNGSIGGPVTAFIKTDSASANADTLAVLGKAIDQAGAFMPAGRDSRLVVDAPVAALLTDARAEAARLIAADTQCRNTVVILVVGGGEGGTSNGDPAATASTFLNVSGRRVPIYVIAIAPAAGSVAQLQAIAQNSGGAYVEITRAMIEAVPANGTVPDVVRAANMAIQHAFAAQADVDTAPSAALPLGPVTEWQTAGPLVGTVDLENARDASGAALANTRITTETGTLIPQRGNVLLTAGFGLPGFTGRLRAFRMYRPEADATKPYGWAFVTDGTPLWTARVPAAASRNIYTVLPDGQIVAFSAENTALLSPYLNTADPAGLIQFVRGQPLGAIVGSTPATLDPPSLDPPPDRDYPAFATSLAGRRSMIFVGANDGMLHAIDGRTGVEAWALVPFNLLPKLKALLDGQAPGAFTYFVDGSPKIADVRVGGAWRSVLIVGEGAGGTFYQAFDVSLDAMPAAVPSSSDDTTGLLSYFAVADRIPLVWSFPAYANFDAAIAPYGDVAAGATAIEKTVGESWSDPAVGQVESADGRYVALVGSGFLRRSLEQQFQRGGISAGTTFYMLDMSDGRVLDSRNVGNDGVAETLDNCVVNNDCRRMKNALQADPVATGPLDARFVTRAYIGDLDGRVWRFNLGLDGSKTPRFTSEPRLLFDATNVHPIFSSMASVNVGGSLDYLFFGSGSDSLPSNGVSQSYKLFGVLDNAGVGSKKFEVALEATDRSAGDEQVSAFPAVAGDIVFFSTTTFRPTTPCTAPTANLYAVTFVGGAAYDSTGDGRLTKDDTPKLRSVVGGRATAPFAADQHLVFAAGGKVEILGDPRDYNNGVGQMGVRILSWRERR